MKYRIYGIGAETYGRLGVSVVTLPGGEIVPALERGVIEGAEWINCVEDKKLGLNNVAKHYYTPGMHEPVTGGQIVINGDVWKKLSPGPAGDHAGGDRQCHSAAQFHLNRETAQACQELIREGVTLHRTPDDILVSFLEEWEKIQAEYAEKDPFYKKVIESQKQYAELHRAVQAVLVPAVRPRGQVLLEGQDLPDHRSRKVEPAARAYPKPRPGFRARRRALGRRPARGCRRNASTGCAGALNAGR